MGIFLNRFYWARLCLCSANFRSLFRGKSVETFWEKFFSPFFAVLRRLLWRAFGTLIWFSESPKQAWLESWDNFCKNPYEKYPLNLTLKLEIGFGAFDWWLTPNSYRTVFIQMIETLLDRKQKKNRYRSTDRTCRFRQLTKCVIEVLYLSKVNL